MRLESLTPASATGEPEHVGSFALLLYTPRAVGAGPTEAPAAASAAWWSALSASLSAERARRMHERLADVSRELGESQARLTEAQSLARLGEMTAGAAHEMNNPLTVISLKAQSLLAEMGDPSQIAALRAIVNAADDLSEFITVLHVLSQPVTPNPGACRIGAVLDRAVELSTARLRRDVKIAVRLEQALQAPGFGLVTDPELLAIALAELITNAAEADPNGEPLVSGTVDELDGRVVLAVMDRGPGFSPRALEHGFDAFFSEKPAGRQKGLGLTRARRMVESIGGEIGLRNEPDRGASVSISIAASGGNG
jgi:C4-dicarboxylate-specific signal transduction histidine kinase